MFYYESFNYGTLRKLIITVISPGKLSKTVLENFVLFVVQ